MQSVATRLVVFLLLVNAFVYLLAGAALFQGRRQQEASARASTQNLARSVAITVSGMLDKLDVGLSAVAMEVAHEDRNGGIRPASLTAYLARQKALLHDFEDLWIADGSGTLRWGTNLQAGAPVNVGERAYFRQAMQAGGTRLVVSGPVIGKVNGTWAVIVARRIDRADGSVLGVAMGSLRLADAFKAIFAPIDLGEHGMVSLRDEGMTVLARYSPGARQGTPLGTRGLSAAGRQALRSDPLAATYVAASALDGIERTISYQRLDYYPMYVFVGRESRELLAPWISEARTAAALLLLFTLATGIYSWANWRHARARMLAGDAEQQAVHLQGKRLQTILDTAPVGVAFSVGGRLQFGNPKAIEMFGERMGSEAAAFYVDPAEGAALEADLRKGGAVARELRLRDRSQCMRDMLVTCVPTTLDEQAGVLVWLVDITERKRSEEQIRQANVRNDTALGLTRAGYWELPLDGSDRFLPSARAAEIFGLVPRPEGEYRLSRDWLPHIEAVDPQAAGGLADRLREMMAGRLDRSIVAYPFRRPVDGRVVWIQGYGTLAHDAAGGPVFHGAAQDVTAHVRVQEELERAKDAATAATRAKSEFLANMSHEIRTPLNAILGLAHLLQREAATPRQVERLHQIQAAGEHLLALVNDVLDLSKIEAQRLQLDDVPFAVGDVLREAVAVIGPQAQAKGLRLVTRCEGLPGRVRGDPTRLRQALLNYLSNAVKFTPRGSVRLRCVPQDASAQELHLRFEVEDSGIGIAPGRVGRLFRPFEQIDVSAARSTGGTGLGLAITRHLAEMMGGTVGVTSRPGEGSLFWFTVRLARAPAEAQEGVAAQRGDSAAAVRERHAGARVLLAEDHPVGAEVAIDLLQDAGLVVDWARDGAEAVAMARRGDYALVLMDMQMPGLDGLEATRAIRRLPGWATKPIVALTANAFEEDRRRCSEAGMDAFLAKPVKPGELYGTLAAWLDAAAGAQRARDALDSSISAPSPLAGASLPADAAECLHHIAALPGMDGARVREFAARPAKFIRLFCGLVEQGVQQAPLLRAQLAAGDHAQAQGMAHALKGAAALLGAEALVQAAAGLEQALKAAAGPDTLARALAALEAALLPLRPAAGAAAPAQAEPLPSTEERPPCNS